MRLEDVTAGAQILGIAGDAPVTVVAVTWIGGNALRLTYRTDAGRLDERLLYRDHEPRLELAKRGAAYDLTADAAKFKLAAEALRIRMAGRFDPMLAVHTSDLEPLPHQIQAVYGELLGRTPLRFLLADDPGAGKTIMAGLYIKELMLRGDLERCLIVAPGGLVEQWQDELRDKFGLNFELLTRQLADAEPPTAEHTVFTKHKLLIARMDQLSRSDDLQRPAGPVRLGPGGRRRGAPDVGALLRQRAEEDQALPARRAARPARPAPAADDRDPARGTGRGLPAVPGAAGHRPVRGPVPGRGAHGEHRRADAPHGQGGPEDLRRQAAVPRAPRLHRRLRAVRRRAGPVRGGHPVRPRGDEPRRPAQGGRATPSAASPSASRSPCCSGGSPPAPRRS